MDPCLRKMLTQTVYVSGSASYKPGGGLTLGTPVAVDAYIEEVKERTLNAIGDETLTTHRIFTEVAVDKDSVIWLPGEDQTDPQQGHRVQRVKTFYDPIRPKSDDGTARVDHYETEI